MSNLSDDDRLNFIQRGIVDNLDEDSLRALCRQLRLDCDASHRKGFSGKVWAMLEQVKKKGQVTELLSFLKQQHPEIDWDDLAQGTSSATATLGASQEPTKQHPGLFKSLSLYNAIVAAVITGIFTLIGIAITGYINLQVADKPIAATQTAETKLTAIAKLWTATPVPVNSPTPALLFFPSMTPITIMPTSAIIEGTPTMLVTRSSQPIQVTVIGMTDTPFPTSPPIPPTESLSISQQTTGEFFGGELVLVVYDASYRGGKTTFGISAPGFPEETISDATIGYRHRYDKNGVYEIVVTGFSAYSSVAGFNVTRLQKPSQGVPGSETVTICANESATIFQKSLTLAVFKASWETNQVSLHVFAPGTDTLRVENESVGQKFPYTGLSKYEIQIMGISRYNNCATFTIWRLW